MTERLLSELAVVAASDPANLVCEEGGAQIGEFWRAVGECFENGLSVACGERDVVVEVVDEVAEVEGESFVALFLEATRELCDGTVADFYPGDPHVSEASGEVRL